MNLRPRKPGGLNTCQPSTSALSPDQAPEYGCLCVDIGTTASRLAFGSIKLRGKFNTYPEVVQRTDPRGANSFESCDWPSAMKCFAYEKVPEDCIGFINDSPELLPLKMFPYVIRTHKLKRRNLPGDVKAIEAFRKQIPQLRDFMDRFDKLDDLEQARVVAHGLAIYITHLRQVKAESERQALSKNILIKELGATIPSNWDRWIQVFFINILKKVWNDIDENAIELIKESHAAANWLMWLSPEMQRERPSQVIVADFGGHTFSYDAFHIFYHHNRSDKFSTVALRETRCIHAGSELHAADVRREVKKSIVRQRRTAPLPPKETAEIYEGLMAQYHYFKHERLFDGIPFTLDYKPRMRRKGEQPFEVQISDHVANELYHKCFGKALKSLENLVKSESIQRGTNVVLTGGSFRNDHVREAAEKIIQDAGLVCPEWPTSRTVGNSKASKIVGGAVLCLGNAGSVSEFMARAAFAVQITMYGKSTIHVVWNRGREYPFTKSILENPQGADLMLICSPQGIDGPVPRGHAGEDFLQTAYDFKLIDKSKKDQLRITMKYYNNTTSEVFDHEIILKIEHLHTRGPPSILRWPIFFDKSAGLCIVDTDAETRLLSQDQVANSRATRSASLRRANRKGEGIRRDWESDHNDSGRTYWEKTEALSDVDLDAIERDGERAARQSLVQNTLPGHDYPPATTMPAPHSLPQAHQYNVRTRQELIPQPSIASPPEGSTGNGRKRRGTATAAKSVTPRKKAVRFADTTTTTNSPSKARSSVSSIVERRKANQQLLCAPTAPSSVLLERTQQPATVIPLREAPTPLRTLNGVPRAVLFEPDEDLYSYSDDEETQE